MEIKLMKKINIHKEAEISAEGKLYSRHCKPIVCVAIDGSEFRSFSSVDDASKALNINPGYISTCMTRKKLCKGYRFCDTKDVVSIIGEMANIINNNAEAAKKYRHIEAEKEAARLAHEQHMAAIAKAEAKVTKLAASCAKYQEKLNVTMAAYDDASKELEALLDQSANKS
jgi:hypothetical protein